MNHNKGFTLLYAVVVTSILLASALSIISIALRELALTTSSRESQYAFYIANTGMECAQYWDTAGVPTIVTIDNVDSIDVVSVFPKPNDATSFTNGYVGSFPVTCLVDETTESHDIRGADVGPDNDYHYVNTNSTSVYQDNNWDIDEGVSPSTARFRISFTGTPEGACADVTVTKTQDTTVIESRGYNTCASSKRRVERGVQISY